MYGHLLSPVQWCAVKYLKIYALELPKTQVFSALIFAAFKECKQDDNAIFITYCILGVFAPRFRVTLREKITI